MSTLGDKLRALAPTFDAEGRTVLNPGYRHGFLDLAAEADALETERDEWKRQWQGTDDMFQAAKEESFAARRELDELRQRVEGLADAMAAVPDYIVSEYDRGRVEQRHMDELELRAALDPAPPHREHDNGPQSVAGGRSGER